MGTTERIDSIPDELPACQEQLGAALERLRDLERQLDEFVATTEELQRSYDCLKEGLLALERLLFGPRRERLPGAPGQQHLKDGVTAVQSVANRIARCLAAPGLLAFVMVSKFSEHLPLYRQQDVL